MKSPSPIKRITNRSKEFLSSYPGIFVPLYRFLVPKHRERLVGANTDIVIEGFPRSANTFAYFAFKYVQEKELRIAHHLHVVSQILEGVRRQIPVLVLIRKPEDAVRSLCARHPSASQERALTNWIHFYRVVEANANKVVIADFLDITKNFGGVISRLNQKFNTSYLPFVHTPENEKNVFLMIEEFNRKFGEDNEMQISRPSAERNAAYSKFVFRNDGLAADASAIYSRLVNTTHSEL